MEESTWNHVVDDGPRRPIYEFDHVSYDNDGDVLYLRCGEQQAAAGTFGTPEGHAVRLDEDGKVIGIMIVNAEWLLSAAARSTSPRQA